jgi:hypothetical protein
MPTILALALLCLLPLPTPGAGENVGGLAPGHYYLNTEYDAFNGPLGKDVDGDGRADTIWCGEACAIDLYNLGVAMGWWSGPPVTPLQYELRSAGSETGDDSAGVLEAFRCLSSGALSKVFDVKIVSLLNTPSDYHTVLVLGAVERDGRRYLVIDDESSREVGRLLVVPLSALVDNLYGELLEFFGPVDAVNRLYEAVSPFINPLLYVAASRSDRRLVVVTLTGLPDDALRSFARRLWELALQGYPVVVAVRHPFLSTPGVRTVEARRGLEGDRVTQSAPRVGPGDGPAPPLGLPIPFTGTVIGGFGLLLLVLAYLGLAVIPIP